MAITTYTLKSTDKELMTQIADWYYDEWAIPQQRTIDRLTNHPSHDVLFQLVIMNDNQPVASGGLYNNVGLFIEHPGFKIYGPWVALLYTDKSHRNKGVGATLLQQIEKYAAENGFTNIFLYTFTAEGLYEKNGWLPVTRVLFRGHDTVVMKKEMNRPKITIH